MPIGPAARAGRLTDHRGQIDAIIMYRILTIEDEANIRRFLAVNLAARGYSVLEAESVEEGFPLLEEERPDLLLLDIRLPGASGWSLLERMQRDPELRHIPVVVVSGNAESRPISSSSAPNLKGVIPKPVPLPTMLNVVRGAVESPPSTPHPGLHN